MIEVKFKRDKKHDAIKGTLKGVESAMKQFTIGVESQAKAISPCRYWTVKSFT